MSRPKRDELTKSSDEEMTQRPVFTIASVRGQHMIVEVHTTEEEDRMRFVENYEQVRDNLLHGTIEERYRAMEKAQIEGILDHLYNDFAKTKNDLSVHILNTFAESIDTPSVTEKDLNPYSYELEAIKRSLHEIVDFEDMNYGDYDI